MQLRCNIDATFMNLNTTLMQISRKFDATKILSSTLMNLDATQMNLDEC